jgi:hypothetical protein
MDTDARLRRQIRYGHAAVETVTVCASLLKCDGSEKAAVYAVTLHATITELFAGCLVLAEANRPAGVPILLRPIFEALVDLHNLLRDGDYYERMDAANLEQMLKLLEQAPTNPLIAGLADLHDVERYRREFAAELDELRAAKRGPLDFASRCIRAEREDQYRTLYGLYCLDSHNNVAALAERHIEHRPDGAVSAVSFFVGHDPAMTQCRMDLAAGFFVEAAGMIHAAFKTNAPGIAALEAQYAAEHALVVADVKARWTARKTEGEDRAHPSESRAAGEV